MLKFIKYLLILISFVLISCPETGVLVEKKGLELQFENIWWEVVDIPSILGLGGSNYCYYFDTERTVEIPSDGVVLYYEEGEEYSYILSDFERFDGGYYLSKYDIFLEIYVDDYGNYSGGISWGIINHKTDIIPCSLGS